LFLELFDFFHFFLGCVCYEESFRHDVALEGRPEAAMTRGLRTLSTSVVNDLTVSLDALVQPKLQSPIPENGEWTKLKFARYSSNLKILKEQSARGQSHLTRFNKSDPFSTSLLFRVPLHAQTILRILVQALSQLLSQQSFRRRLQLFPRKVL
jgi:hypothetical protein